VGLIAAGVVVAVVAGLGVADRGTIGRGFAGLDSADPRWLVVAALSAGLLWLASALSQAGAVRGRLPFGRLCAVQVASSFADHLLPGRSGGMAVNLRFLRRQGFSRSAATSAVLIRTFVGWSAHVLLLAALVLWRPAEIDSAGLPSWLWLPLGGGLVAVGAAVALVRRTPDRGPRPVRWVRRMVCELRDGFTVMRDPGRAGALWGGSLVTPMLHSAVLYSVARSLGVQLGLVHVLILYLVAAALTGMVPAPGAIGALDVALIAALVAAGVPGTAAAGTTIAYRMFTVWLPLLPAGALLAVLIRRSVV
jgi:uncharacterized membrane protein YbhN (UPF0104 family)